MNKLHFYFLFYITLVSCQNKENEFNATFVYIEKEMEYKVVNEHFYINDSHTLIIRNKDKDSEAYYPILPYASSGKMKKYFVIGFYVDTDKCSNYKNKNVKCIGKRILVMYDGVSSEIIGIAIEDDQIEGKSNIYMSEKGKEKIEP